MHSELEEIIGQLQRTSWAADVFDPAWNLVWVSDGLKDILGERDDEALGYGQHILAVRALEPWQRVLDADARRELLLHNAAYWLHDTPGGREAVMEICPEPLRERIGQLEPAAPPPVWTWDFEYASGELPKVRVSAVATRVFGSDGDRLGTSTIYGPGLSPRMSTLLVRGDEAMFERMARLVEPHKRQAAILFADLEASSLLARHLSTSAYFNLIKDLIATIDRIVLQRDGIIGKHAGDGVTAFFLAEEAGDASSAARAALEAALAIAEASSDRDDEHDCVLNIGVHWGATLYMGQVATEGRLEVTALGDEVNEAARIQESARGGDLLASKSLIEQLDDDDASALSLQPEELVYTTLSELPDVPEKAVRDAGGVAVTSLRPDG
jgi:class 3 adenylate cyclase